MNNPFQVESPPYSKRIATRMRKGKTKPTIWFGMLATVLAALVLAWGAGQLRWLPMPFRGMSPLPFSGNRIFAAQIGGASQEQSRALYRTALTDLQDGNYEKALGEFKQLEAAYPGLEDFLWLHEAESYAGQGNEWAVQKKLNALIGQHPESALKTLALYRIGQSQIRGSEWEKAKQTFEKVQQDEPKSTYAQGALYYLGLIQSQNTATRTEAIKPLKAYLTQCHDCKFSGEAADLMEKLLPHPSEEEHGLIGLADAASGKDIKKTLAHLSQGPHHHTWLALGQSQIRAGQKPQGLQTLITGLPYASDMESARAGIDLILADTPAEKRAAVLAQLQAKQLPIGGDYVLWKAADVSPDKALSFYQTILNQYPQSDYAPESGWNLLWPVLSNGDIDAYLAQAQQYISKYPYARSAPKALFWMGKLLEKSNAADSKRAYQQIISQYPTTYYAFRAVGRMKALEGKGDPGWATITRRTGYPLPDVSINNLDLLPPAPDFGLGPIGAFRRDMAKELQAIGAADDAKLMVNEATGHLPPAIESWADQASGDRAKGLRVIRDALEQQAKDAFLASGGKPIQPPGTKDELKLLYPIYFDGLISRASGKNSLDPFLIQSLMREESYFNEFAISGSNARGLMQLMPATAQEVSGWEGLSGFQVADLFKPEVNIQLGSRYLSHLHTLFQGNSMPAIGAYNGGPGAMSRWVHASNLFSTDPDMFVERIPYAQSRDYIKKVFTSYWNYTQLYSDSPI